MAAAIAIERLVATQEPKTGVAWVFCNYRSQTQQGVSALLAALLKQLVQGQPALLPIVARLHDQHKNNKSRMSREEIFQGLLEACSILTCTLIVVDALDECSDQYGARSQLIEQLRRLQARADVRLLFTSRPMPEVTTRVKADATLEVRTGRSDIERYVNSQLYRMSPVVKRSSELQQQIIADIVASAKGMFLLARLQCDALVGKTSVIQVRSMLRSLRSGAQTLDAAYDDALQRIDAQLQAHRLLGRQAISWVTYGRRPLTTVELCHALAISRNGKQIDSNSVSTIGDVLAVCAGLLVVDNESQVVRLVHYTTQQYLERVRSQWLPDAERQLAEACLTYVSFDAFRIGSCPTDGEYERRLNGYPLVNYCGQNWGWHVQAVQEALLKQIVGFLLERRLLESVAQAAIETSSRYTNYSQNFQRKTTAFHVAAKEGLGSIVRKLLAMDTGINLNSKDSDSQTPLLVAAARGHEEVVRLLIHQECVDVNCKDSVGWPPLMVAISGSHVGIVRALLRHKRVDINAIIDTGGRTPLLWAAAEGREKMVKILIEQEGIDVNVRDDHYGRTPLLWAIAEGHEGIVKMLTEHKDVDFRSMDTTYALTPIALAVAWGRKGMVKILIEHDGVNLDSDDEDEYDLAPRSRGSCRIM